MKMQIWVDCDGVLADFDKLAIEILGDPPAIYEKKYGSLVFWDKLSEYDHFYLNLDLMPDAQLLMSELRKNHDPIVLTGCPKSLGETARVDKFQWVERMFGVNQRMVACKSKHKSAYCSLGDILIDDRDHYEDKWSNAGGVFLKHYNTETTLLELKKLGVI